MLQNTESRNTVSYLRTIQAVSSPGFEPVSESRESNVLTTEPQ